MFLNKYLFLLLIWSTTSLKADMTSEGFERFLNYYFVETGTNSGGGVKLALRANFSEIHSIEIDNNLATNAQIMFKNFNNIHIWIGDSGSILWNVIKDMNKPITFWLDGHNSSGILLAKGKNTPILNELDQIKLHPIKTHTIIIDDVRLFGSAEFDFITKEQVIQKILGINPHYVITYVNGTYGGDIMVAQINEK